MIKTIQESALPEKDKKELFDYFKENPEKISWFEEILKRKIEAMKKNDNRAWAEILAEETKEIKKILEK